MGVDITVNLICTAPKCCYEITKSVWLEEDDNAQEKINRLIKDNAFHHVPDGLLCHPCYSKVEDTTLRDLVHALVNRIERHGLSNPLIQYICIIQGKAGSTHSVTARIMYREVEKQLEKIMKMIDIAEKKDKDNES